MTTAESAKRTIDKRTYVPLQVNSVAADVGGNAIAKQGFVRNLSLQVGEVDTAIRAMSSARAPVRATGGTAGTGAAGAAASFDPATAAILRKFEGQPLASELPKPAAFASMPVSGLLAFGNAVAALRKQAVMAAATPPPVVPPAPAPVAGATARVSSVAAARTAAAALAPAAQIESAQASALPSVVAAPALQIALNSALVAVTSFQNQVSATPVGMLNLERVEMTPAGIERGELVGTIPLAPAEQTAVVQKEWSVTTKEFTSIVTDSLENYSETGVTENNELTQSTTSQIQHSNQFNINATVSGGCSFVTATVNTSFGTQDSSSKSATESEKHAKQTTQLASSRVKQEHKTTISTTTVTGSAETTTRTLVNPSATDPMRIDYFSLMRKWRVRLYRYGLRMTYDLAIPEPGATLRELFAQIDQLNVAIDQTFSFPLQPTDITPANFLQKAADFGASVPEPSEALKTTRVGGPAQGLGKLGEDEAWHFFEIDFSVPDGYEVTGVWLDAQIGNVTNNPPRAFVIFGYGAPPDLVVANTWAFVIDLIAANHFLEGATGPQKIIYRLQNVDAAAVTFALTFTPTRETMAAWQMAAWQALHDAARDQFYAQQAAWAQQRDELKAKLDVDTLTLRREENDEIMKGVLRWLLGTGFEFMPAQVANVFKAAGGDLQHGVAFTGNDLGISPALWTTMYQYEEMVKFINEAIEWENVLYFLYSYFWDVPLSWDFVRQIEHPDSTRQAFLRAGSARIVLPVRKGYEQAWLAFVELGNFGQQLPPNHPYMTIAQQIQAYDDTNYPGIAPANPGAVPVEPVDMAAAASSQKIAASTAPVTVTVDAAANFLVGAQVTIDTFESGVQEVQVIKAVPDSTHVTVAALTNAHDGTKTPFPLVQPGESGVIIAEWNEYTPTSGIDIAVTSNLATIA